MISVIPQISPDIIRQWLFSLEQTSHNPGGIHACYRTLRAFLNWFEEEYEPDNWKNPIRKVKAPRVPQEPIWPIERAEFDKLLSTCDKSWHGTRDKAILHTLLDSGVRASELCNPNLKDLDLTFIGPRRGALFANGYRCAGQRPANFLPRKEG